MEPKRPAPISYSDCPEWALRVVRGLAVRLNKSDLLARMKRECNEGLAQIFLVERSFFVLRPFCDQGNLVVLVWIAGSETGSGIADYTQDVKRLARAVGAHKLLLKTPFRGVAILSARQGWKISSDDKNTQEITMEISL